MSALDQALEIPIVKLEHPRLCKDAAAELAALRAEVETLKEAFTDVMDGKSEYWLLGEGFTPERCKELSDLYYKLIGERKSAA